MTRIILGKRGRIALVQSEAKIDIEKLFTYFFLLSGDVFCSGLFL